MTLILIYGYFEDFENVKGLNWEIHFYHKDIWVLNSFIYTSLLLLTSHPFPSPPGHKHAKTRIQKQSQN